MKCTYKGRLAESIRAEYEGTRDEAAAERAIALAEELEGCDEVDLLTLTFNAVKGASFHYYEIPVVKENLVKVLTLVDKLDADAVSGVLIEKTPYFRPLHFRAVWIQREGDLEEMIPPDAFLLIEVL